MKPFLIEVRPAFKMVLHDPTFRATFVALKVECRITCYNFRLFAQCLARQRVASF